MPFCLLGNFEKHFIRYINMPHLCIHLLSVYITNKYYIFLFSGICYKHVLGNVKDQSLTGRFLFINLSVSTKFISSTTEIAVQNSLSDGNYMHFQICDLPI